MSSAKDSLEEVPVLIVGGSLVGLSAAAFLASQGVETLSVERHRGTAIHPRAGHFQLRTMEVLRSIGLQDIVRQAAEEQYDLDFGIAAVESLAGRKLAVFIQNLNEGVDAVSPSTRFFYDTAIPRTANPQTCRRIGCAAALCHRDAVVRSGFRGRHGQNPRHRQRSGALREGALLDCKRR